ncbi:MAG TPA: N-6 DNA methylase [Ktedonobacteraceae bacterium]|nr:N-6 DNA methylase [Ktedonobacteraceae bacterium]
MSMVNTGGMMKMEHGNWYEASLPLWERKQRGHFSTPPLLVERILDACGYCPENDLSHLRVLDPACGGGNFLAGAARRLAAYAARAGLSQDELAALVARNLWGFDPDPVSCFLAEMNVRAQCQPCDSEVRLHIHQADGLALPWDGYEEIDLFLANPPYLAAKNIDLSGYRSTHRGGQLDSYLLFLDLALAVVRSGGWLGLVLPDAALARSNASRQRARLLETCTITHLWHLSGVFAASVGAVVLIAQKRPAPAKHVISWERASWSCWSCDSDRQNEFEGQDERGEQSERSGKSEPSKPHRASPSTVSQSLFQIQPGAELRYLLSSERGALIERLRAHLEHGNGSERRLVPLSDFLTIRRGEELGRKSAKLVHEQPPSALAGQPHVAPAADQPPTSAGQPQMFPDPPPADQPQADASGWPGEAGGWLAGSGLGTYFPVLLGGVDVKPYGRPAGKYWLAGEAIEKPLERYLVPKLLVVKSTGQLQAALDVDGHVVLQTLYLLHARAGAAVDVDDLYFFLALLNSRLLREYVYVLHTAYKWVQPQIEQQVLARLPVPLARTPQKREIGERAKRLMELLEVMGQMEVCSEARGVVELKQQWQSLYEEQERAIDALYAAALSEIELTMESRRYSNG